jgi:hypothetical protein
MNRAATLSRSFRLLPRGVEPDFDHGRFFDQVGSGYPLTRSIARSAAVMLVGSAVYGGTFGLWRSGLLAVYVAVKLPLLLGLTAGLVMLLNWMLAQVASSGLRLAQVAALTCRAMAVACVVLASMAPITTFLAMAVPPPDPQADLPHNLLLLGHVMLVAVAGLYGNHAMFQGLRRLSRPQTRVRGLYACWLATHLVVGGQLAWLLRPFLGSPSYPVVFLRPDALEGNFYEFLAVTIIWKRFLGGG